MYIFKVRTPSTLVLMSAIKGVGGWGGDVPKL